MPNPWSDGAADIKIFHSKLKIHTVQQDVKSYSAISKLVLKNRLRALKDLAIFAKDQEASKATSEPAIMGHGYYRSFITIKGRL